eukprot:CAMPEP_0181076688 /NCGR_PEP_ID=MMETSP1071-20121207/553_1 /TAXON_ID=35127 /ORGANISM="Thalassiosira sp., Strain NH16" /LENGTH=123 /DNA_ID=CAMNT_0023157887 /DNA_START=147 /DNA_END=518 /DNA_ORIENTATION=+
MAKDKDDGGGQKMIHHESITEAPPPLHAATGAKSPASMSHHINAVRRLDEEYDHLLTVERNIEKSLHQLGQEEASLRLALKQSSTSLKDQREKEAKRKDKEAVARLEEALMMDENSDDSSSSC